MAVSSGKLANQASQKMSPSSLKAGAIAKAQAWENQQLADMEKAQDAATPQLVGYALDEEMNIILNWLFQQKSIIRQMESAHGFDSDNQDGEPALSSVAGRLRQAKGILIDSTRRLERLAEAIYG